jgi:hypothetical protein
VPRGTLVPNHQLYLRLPGYHRLWPAFPKPFNFVRLNSVWPTTPLRVWTGSLSLATTREIVSFPLGTKMFQFPRFPSHTYVFSVRYTGIPRCGFPHSDIFGSNGRTHLTEAFRSVPRPSSAVDAKASTVCS